MSTQSTRRDPPYDTGRDTLNAALDQLRDWCEAPPQSQEREEADAIERIGNVLEAADRPVSEAPGRRDTELPMSPAMFAETMHKVFDLNDQEDGHAHADGLMIQVLRALGYGEGCDVFEKASKWYA